MFKVLIRNTLGSILLLLNLESLAAGTVIVNPANSDNLTAVDIQNIYLAKVKTFSDGSTITAVNLAEGNATRTEFEKNVCDKTDSQMKSYWAKLVFTGKAIPIKQLDSDQAVIDFVASNKSAIGYINKSSATGAVKVIHEFLQAAFRSR